MSTHYVYEHFDPDTGEVVYIGHGWKGRAWVHGSRKAVVRSVQHTSWLDEVDKRGYLPCDYVRIVARGLVKSEACIIEQERIRTNEPVFNKPQGLQNMKMTPELLEWSLKLREHGHYYNEIAETIGLSTMTVYRAINKQTKNLKGNTNAG